MSLKIVTPPSAEPVTVAEVKARLRLTSTADDATIAVQITAAREFAEKITRQSLALKSYKLLLDCFPWPHEPIRLPVPPLISVTAITYFDSVLNPQTWDSSEYGVYNIGFVPAGGLIKPLPGFIYPVTGQVPGAVEIDFTAGAAPPEHVKEGIRQLTVHIYSHPEAVTSEGLKEAPLSLTSFFEANKVFVF